MGSSSSNFRNIPKNEEKASTTSTCICLTALLKPETQAFWVVPDCDLSLEKHENFLSENVMMKYLFTRRGVGASSGFACCSYFVSRNVEIFTQKEIVHVLQEVNL